LRKERVAEVHSTRPFALNDVRVQYREGHTYSFRANKKDTAIKTADTNNFMEN
jgi:hypothetical protein